MKRWFGWAIGILVLILLCAGSIMIFLLLPRPIPIEPTATIAPTLTAFDLDVRSVALIATYEAQVFPEPLRSDAFRAVSWTMRNRVDTHYNGVSGYRDEQLLTKYTSYKYHSGDEPDERAVQIAREVLLSTDPLDDPIRGARHFVDNSFWTGTHEQRMSPRVSPWSPNDLDVTRLVRAGYFILSIEWKTPPDQLPGPQLYGLYFFDYWPPPAVPTPTATATTTRTPTPTRTMTPTRTTIPTRTRSLSSTAVRPSTATPTVPASSAATPQLSE